MGKQALKYGAVLIATYLAVYYGTGSGNLVTAGTTGGVGIIKAFQGR